MKMLDNNSPETDNGVSVKSHKKKNPKNIQTTTKIITVTHKFQNISPRLSLLTIDKPLVPPKWIKEILILISYTSKTFHKKSLKVFSTMQGKLPEKNFTQNI